MVLFATQYLLSRWGALGESKGRGMVRRTNPRAAPPTDRERRTGSTAAGPHPTRETERPHGTEARGGLLGGVGEKCVVHLL